MANPTPLRVATKEVPKSLVLDAGQFARLDLSGLGDGNLGQYFMTPPGANGNLTSIVFIGDSDSSLSVVVDTNTVNVHFNPGVSLIGDFQSQFPISTAFGLMGIEGYSESPSATLGSNYVSTSTFSGGRDSVNVNAAESYQTFNLGPISTNDSYLLIRRMTVTEAFGDGTSAIEAASAYFSLYGITASMIDATISVNATGVVGNGLTIVFVADGEGSVSTTGAYSYRVAHYIPGVSTLAQAFNAVNDLSGLSMTLSFDGDPTTVVLQSGDAFTATTEGGVDGYTPASISLSAGTEGIGGLVFSDEDLSNTSTRYALGPTSGDGLVAGGQQLQVVVSTNGPNLTSIEGLAEVTVVLVDA